MDEVPGWQTLVAINVYGIRVCGISCFSASALLPCPVLVPLLCVWCTLTHSHSPQTSASSALCCGPAVWRTISLPHTRWACLTCGPQSVQGSNRCSRGSRPLERQRGRLWWTTGAKPWTQESVLGGSPAKGGVHGWVAVLLMRLGRRLIDDPVYKLET